VLPPASIGLFIPAQHGSDASSDVGLVSGFSKPVGVDPGNSWNDAGDYQLDILGAWLRWPGAEARAFELVGIIGTARPYRLGSGFCSTAAGSSRGLTTETCCTRVRFALQMDMKMKTLTLRIQKSLDNWLSLEAKRLGRTKSEIAREALDRARNGHKKNLSMHDRMKDLCGIIKGAPPDLSTNMKKYLKGFGE